MLNDDMPAATRPLGRNEEISAMAAGHLDLLRAYFGLQACGGVVAGGLLVLSLFAGPGAHRITMHGHAWLGLPLAALNTWAAFRTRRLLGEHELEGVWMAAVILGCDLLGAVTTGYAVSGLLPSGTGLVLLGSVYRGFRPALWRFVEKYPRRQPDRTRSSKPEAP